jgi:hypothetical protein
MPDLSQRYQGFFLAFFLLPSVMFATELKPWFGKNLEIESRTGYLLQAYRSIDVVRGPHHLPSVNSFFHLSLSFAATDLSVASIPDMSAEIEAVAADTRHRSFGMDALKATGRFRWMNDVPGDDPISLTTGLTLTQVFKQALHDIGSFHHGGIEAEAHVAFGKEHPWKRFWTSRWWGVFAIGIADIGSPWLRGQAAWEHNKCDKHRLRFFCDSLWGLGKRGLRLYVPFRGYGPIHHQSVDVGIRYSYLFDWAGRLSVGYARRIYALNCPKNANTAFISIFYPFGL